MEVSNMELIEFLANARKSRDLDDPYMVFVLGDWEWRVLSVSHKWQDKPAARWFCAVRSPYTFGSFDFGDTYVHDVLVVAGAWLRDVDGKPATLAQREAIAELASRVPNPMG
jgi:hypothetical protein